MAEKTYDWEQIAKNSRFVELKRTKNRFLFSWWIAATIYYFLLPIISGYLPDLFKIKVLGVINFGYLFILSQFLVAFGIAIYYAHKANRDFDRLTQQLLAELK